jgi:hypothetical protein
VVERLEGIRVTARHAADEVAVRQPGVVGRSAGRFPAGALGHGSGQGKTDSHLFRISTKFHVLWIAAEGRPDHNQDPYETLKNRLPEPHV